MKVLGKGLTRRGILKRLALAVALIPTAPLAKTLNEKEKLRQRKKSLEDPETIWLGHC